MEFPGQIRVHVIRETRTVRTGKITQTKQQGQGRFTALPLSYGGSLAHPGSPAGAGENPRLIRKLALPGIVAQLINILYNIVDRMYVGHMREHAAISLTGLGVAAPIIILIAAFCNMVGSGAAPLAAIELGRKDIHKAETLLGNSFAFLMTLAALLTAGALIFMKPLLYLFGATENSHPFARDYMTLYALGTVFVLLSLGLNTFIACQGHARAAMFTTVIGAVANIILDPVFIYLFDMGVKGAAIATVISQALSAAFVLRFLTSGRSAIRLKRHLIRLHPRILRAIVALGVSGFVINATESAIIMVFNQGLIRYGGEAGGPVCGHHDHPAKRHDAGVHAPVRLHHGGAAHFQLQPGGRKDRPGGAGGEDHRSHSLCLHPGFLHHHLFVPGAVRRIVHPGSGPGCLGEGHPCPCSWRGCGALACR